MVFRRPQSRLSLSYIQFNSLKVFEPHLNMVLALRSAPLSTPEGDRGPKDVAGLFVQESVIEVVDLSQNPSLTIYDCSDMRRLGKKQEYRRVFGPAATFGFISMYLCTWECTCLSGRSVADPFGSERCAHLAFQDYLLLRIRRRADSTH